MSSFSCFLELVDMSMAPETMTLDFGYTILLKTVQEKIQNYFCEIWFGEISKSQKSKIVKKTRAENPWGPSYQFLKTLNMESKSSKTIEMNILDFSIQFKNSLPRTHLPTHPPLARSNWHSFRFPPLHLHQSTAVEDWDKMFPDGPRLSPEYWTNYWSRTSHNYWFVKTKMIITLLGFT